MTGLRRDRAGERGALSFVSIVLLLAVVAGVYSAYKFGPVYLEYNRVKRLVRGATAYWLNVDDDLGEVREKLEIDFDQAMVEHITAEDVEFDRVSGDEVTASFYYEVEVKHPFGKPTVLEFDFDHTEHRRMRTE